MLTNRIHFLPLLLAVVWLGWGAVPAQPKKVTGTRHYMYLSDQRILTVEVIDSWKLILNYINLGQSCDVVEAPLITLVDKTGVGCRGQLIVVEPVVDPAERYKVSELIAPRQFKGLTVLGNFQAATPIERTYVKTGGRVLELEPLLPDDFDKTARLVSGIDLGIEDPKYALQRAGFNRGYGNIHFAGTPEAASFEKWFPEFDVLSPLPLETPSPKLPGKYSTLPEPVVVEISLVVGRGGGLYDLKVVKSPDAALGEIAMETVRNSWRFLPAVSKGQVVTTSVTLRVTFASKAASGSSDAGASTGAQ